MDKKIKAKKGKKTVKQQQQKFGFNVNLDEEEPDIPVEKATSKQEQQFKVVYSKQFKQERPQDKPQNIEIQIKAEHLQLTVAKQPQQQLIQPVNTCDNKEQQIESPIQNQKQQVYVPQPTNLEQQSVEAAKISQNIAQKQDNYEKAETKMIEPLNEQRVRKQQVFNIQKEQVKQQANNKQQLQVQLTKVQNEQILDEQINQVAFESKVVKKTTSKKKDTKTKAKKPAKSILNLDIEQFQQQLELIEHRNSPKHQEIQQVYEKTQTIEQQNIQPHQSQPIIQNKETLALKEQQKQQPKQKQQIPDQIVRPHNNLIQSYEITKQQSRIQQIKEQKGPVQVIQAPAVSKNNQIIQAQMKFDQEQFQPKIEITAKANKKGKKTKTTKKQNKNQIKINLDTETFLIEETRSQIKTQQTEQNKSNTNFEKVQIQNVQQQAIVPQQPQQYTCIQNKTQESTVYIEEKLQQNQQKQQQKQQIVQNPTNDTDQTLNIPQTQTAITTNFKQTQIQKQIDSPNTIIAQKIQSLQPVEIQLDLEVKVSKVKNVKKTAKKDTKNKSGKIQKQITMQFQLEDLQIENITAVQNKISSQNKEVVKKEQEVPISQVNINADRQKIVQENQSQNVKDNLNQQNKVIEQKRPNEEKRPQNQLINQTQNQYIQSQHNKHQNIQASQNKQNQTQSKEPATQVYEESNHNISKPQPNLVQKQIIEQTLNWDQATDLKKQKGKVEVKKTVKKPKAKPKPKTNQLNLFESVLEQQKPIELNTPNISKSQEQVKPLTQNQEKPAQVQPKIAEQNIQIKQSEKIESRQGSNQIQVSEQQLQRQKQLAFYKKLQEQNELQLRMLEENVSAQQTTQQAQKSLNQTQKHQVVHNMEEQKTESVPSKIENALVLTEQQQKKLQVEKQDTINVQEQQMSPKTVSFQVNKQKKTSKKTTKKTKPKQKITSLISVDIMDLGLQQQPIKMLVQQNADKTTNDRKASNDQSILAIKQVQNRIKDYQNVNKEDQMSQSPKIVQFQKKFIESESNKKEERKVSPIIFKPILVVKKADSIQNKSGSIVAQLIDLIRFKGDQDMRIARERLNMLQQDVRSRLLRKGPRPTKLQTKVNQSAEIYGNIIDENISLRQELRNIARG